MSPCHLPAALEEANVQSYNNLGCSVKSVLQEIGTQWPIMALRGSYATSHPSGRRGEG